MSRCVLLLSLLWFLVEVHSQQTFPYVSFMGQTLANHSYVDLSLVGDYYYYDRLGCHTDLGTCCSSYEGNHRGDWYFPNGDRLQFSNGDGDIFEHRDNQRVDLWHRNSANSPVGIYRCDIPTNDVHDDDNSVRDTVYVGLYTTHKGDVTIIGGMTLIYDTNQFTLTCISTGGPATTVTWTRDSTTVTEGNETVLNDPVTAQYTHTLTVTGRLPYGLYTCTVANNKPSSDSVSKRVMDADMSLSVSPSSPVAGDSVTLTCSLTPSSGASGTPEFWWEGSGNGDINTPDFQWEGPGVDESTISEGIKSSELILSEIATSQAGIYNCSAFAAYIKSSITLTVQIPTPIPYISHNTLIAGTEGNLTCDSALSPSVDTDVVESASWAVNGSVLNATRDGRISTNGATLTLSPLYASDSGRYMCTLTVSAPQTPYVAQGPGESSEETIITVQNIFTYFQLRLKGVFLCSELTAAYTEQRMEDIKYALLHQLKTSCSECGISDDIIDTQSFSCSEESPPFVTYRARLEGTSERDSDSLISLIEDWVRGGGASVIVTGILMTVDPHCPVAISSLSEPECSTNVSPTRKADNNTTVFVGVIIVFIAIIAILITVIAALVFRIHQLTGKIKKLEMPVFPGRSTTIPISTNTAYGIIKIKPAGSDSKGPRAGEEEKCEASFQVCLPILSPPSQSEEEVYEVIPGENN